MQSRGLYRLSSYRSGNDTVHVPPRKKTGINVDHVVNVINADIISRVIVLIIIVTVIIIGPVVSKPGIVLSEIQRYATVF